MRYTIPRPASGNTRQKKAVEQEDTGEKTEDTKPESLTPEQWDLVKDNLPLGYWWLEKVKRVYDAPTLHEQDGETLIKMALIQAAKMYDPNRPITDEEGNPTGRKARFSTYATYWIRSYLMNEVRRHYRKPLTLLCDIDHEVEIDPEDYRSTSPHHLTDIRDRVEWVKKWFTPYDWQVLVWHHVDGMTEQQISERLTLAPQRVHQLLERIRRRIKMLRAEGRIS